MLPYGEFRVASWLPVGSSGNWAWDKMDDGCIIARKNGVIWMTDTNDEIEDIYDFTQLASGDILITGLGLGMLPAYLSKLEKIKSITILEKDKDVIDFVGYQLQKNFPKITIIHTDAMSYQTDRNYDFAFHDIWALPPTEEQAKPIMDKYAPLVGEQKYWIRHGFTRT
jgi:hypothetical protein